MTKLEMCYDGALVMPSNYAVMNEQEMTYLEGGAVSANYGKASTLKNLAASLMAAWGSLALGYSYSTAVAATSGIGLPISFATGVGASYCGFVANEYRQAFNYFNDKCYSDSKSRYVMKTYTLLGAITGVGYSVA